MNLTGLIGVPVSKVQRALKFAEAYSSKYSSTNDEYYKQAFDNIVKQQLGKRSLARAFYLVPVSQSEAELIARETLNMSGVILWNKVCDYCDASYAQLKSANERKHTLTYHVKDLKTIYKAALDLDVILLDIESCSILNALIDMANEENFTEQ